MPRTSYNVAMLSPNLPALILAPMEGVTDAPMRALEARLAAFTFAVSEFLRVAQAVPPEHVFYRHVPELRSSARTPTGLPVQVQLLGGDAGRMAGAAVRGSPTRGNGHRYQLRLPRSHSEPSRWRRDAPATSEANPRNRRRHAVRAACRNPGLGEIAPRLGQHRIDRRQRRDGGRGRCGVVDDPRPDPNPRIRPAGVLVADRASARTAQIPVVANGDIWTIEGFRRCREETGCRHFMLGRGALANPRLARQVAEDLGLSSPNAQADTTSGWPERIARLDEWTRKLQSDESQRQLIPNETVAEVSGDVRDFRRFDAIKRAGSVEESAPISGPPREVGYSEASWSSEPEHQRGFQGNPSAWRSGP